MGPLASRALGSTDENEKRPSTEIEVSEFEFLSLSLTHIYLSRTCSGVRE